MADKKIKGTICPICKNESDNKATYCNKCGWEFKVFLTADSEYEKQEKEREKILKDFIAQLSETNKLSQELESKISILEKKLEDANSKIRKHENEKPQIQNTVSGFIILRNRETMEESAVVIYEGYNTYGADNNADQHHQISLDPIVFEFAPKHFSIDTCRPKGWVLKDLVGNSLKTKNGDLPYNGVYIGSGLGPVVINDIIELKIIKL